MLPVPTASPGPDASPGPNASTGPVASPVVPASALTWESLGAMNEAGVKGLVAFDGGYVAYGSTDALGPVAWFSADGRTWTATPLASKHLNCPGWGPPGDDYVPDADVTAGATNGRQVVLAGAEQLFTDAACTAPGSSVRMVAWISSDGRTWQRSDGFAPGTTNARVAGAWPASDGWQVTDEFSGEVWTSADGLAWERAAIVARGTTAAITPVAAGPDGSVVVAQHGQDGGPYFGLAAWNGSTWRDVALPEPCAGEPAMVLPPAVGGSGSSAGSSSGSSSASWLLAAGQSICASADLGTWTSSAVPVASWAQTWELARTRFGLLASISQDCRDCAQPGPWVNYLSTDGRTWAELGSSVQAFHLADGPAGVIALGPEGAAWRLVKSRPVGPSPTPAGPATPSPEPVGRSWVEASVPILADRPVGLMEAVTAGGPGFVAVGRGCNVVRDPISCEAVVWTTADGRAWTRAPASDATNIGAYIPTSGPEVGMFDVAAGPPGIVAIGYAARPTLQATTWFSTDGTSWERIPIAGADLARVSAVTWTGGRFVIVGEARPVIQDAAAIATARAHAAVWTSEDGRTWTRVPHAPVFEVGGFIDTMEDPASGGMRDVVAGPGGLVAVGSVCTSTPAGCLPAAWTSSDGISWVRVTGMPSVPGLLKAVTASGAGYVAVGAQTCNSSPVAIRQPCPALVLTSQDGLAWVQQPFAQAGDLRTVTVVGGRLLATAPDGPAILWGSDDGSAWAAVTPPSGPTTHAPGTIFAGHLAATPQVAVWLGQAGDPPEPDAWVSAAGAP